MIFRKSGFFFFLKVTAYFFFSPTRRSNATTKVSGRVQFMKTIPFATNQLKAQVGRALSDRRDKAIYYFSNSPVKTFQHSNDFHY